MTSDLDSEKMYFRITNKLFKCNFSTEEDDIKNYDIFIKFNETFFVKTT